MSIKEILSKTPFFPIVLCLYKKHIWQKKLQEIMTEGAEMFRKEKPVHGSLKDFNEAARKHLVSYSEYMYQYEFWNLSEKERDEFTTRAAHQLFYLTIPSKAKLAFWDKVLFLEKFDKFIHRDWICAEKVSFEEFEKFLNSHKCIAKPLSSCCGEGIHSISTPSNKKEMLELFEKFKKDNILIEECITGCQEIQQFHPKSLNSIRVVTINGNRGCEVFGAFIRLGVGDSIVDNAHSGGIFAQINVNTGVIESDGIDVYGHHFINHPDSKNEIKGFIIPRWNEIKTTCIEASKIVPENKITGWDVVINTAGNIEFVEGNHGPDFDVMQSPLKIGVKKRLKELLNDY